MTEHEADLTYALGELQNLQTEMETYFDPDQGIILQRLEGIEARLRELSDNLTQYASLAASQPSYAAEWLRERIEA